MKKGKGFFRWLGAYDARSANRCKHRKDEWSAWATKAYMDGFYYGNLKAL